MTTVYSKRGKLRIYFGYAAGVGKTYAMLSDAREAEQSGINVLAGYIEPHDRIETNELARQFTALPLKELIYNNMRLKEFDLDAALEKNPELILVDELAHTNVPGCRNKKRFQDIEELLKAGIDVYTTVNVQHIESLNNIVEKITGIHVNERIPDMVFDNADQIELVDIEPVDLVERLTRGKIYKQSQVERALTNFFTHSKLVALREIALRKTADQVNRVAVRTELNKNSAQTKEHILVAVSASPSSAEVIRAASRIADAFKASFTALYVGDRDEQELTELERTSLRDNLRLAEQLGAQVSTLYGEDIADQITEYAKISHVSKIVLGKTTRSRKWGKSNIIDAVTRTATDIDIYIIPDAKTETNWRKRSKILKPKELSLADSWKTILLLIAATLVGLLFQWWHFNVANIIIVYILGVQINAVVTKGKIYSVISSILSVLVFNYIFTVPKFTLEAFVPGYPITFFIMLTAGLITSSLVKRVKEQARQNAEKAYRTEILLEMNQKLQGANGTSEILDETAAQLVKLLERDVVYYQVKNHILAAPKLTTNIHSQANLASYQALKETAVAEWVFKNNKRAGATTNTLSAAKYLYMSVRNKQEVFAVIGISMDAENPLEIFEKSILIAILGECSLALEKELFQSREQQITSKMEKEQLRANLLRAISHDLRTPLTGIAGNAKILMGNSDELTNKQKQEIYADIDDDANWLINLVENLLSITKLDNDNLNLNLQVNVIDEIITEAVKHVDRHIAEHHFHVHVPDMILTAKVDAQLMIQVLVNIINNAIKYTPKGSTINLYAEKVENFIKIEISDNGPGIPEDAKARIFDQFYTASIMASDSRRGLGLGLSLCKSIITAHGGEIYLKDNVPKGTIIGFRIQAVEVSMHD